MKSPLVVYWTRRDFRLADNPALTAACSASTLTGAPFLPVFVLEDYMTVGDPVHQFGVPSRQFLVRAVPAFLKQFAQSLVVRGKATRFFKTLSETYDLSIYVNDDVYIDFRTQVEKIKAAGITIEVYADALSVDPETRSKEGNLYSVFTPFKKSVWASFIAKRPLVKPVLPYESAYLDASVIATISQSIPGTPEAFAAAFSGTRTFLAGGVLYDLATITPDPVLTDWYYDEAGALARFTEYLTSGGLDAYSARRDSLEQDVEGGSSPVLAGATSKMSLALAWGVVSPRTLTSMMQTHFGESFDNPFSERVSKGALTYISELIWREFYRYQLLHRPELMDTEFQERFRGTIAWVSPDEAHARFLAWIKGETGYPVVDAAMKQIAATGWMHNRSRMIVASILTKNLGVDWRWGQEYFRAALIDLDEASNSGGWQWGASVGADPKPIRIFNPELQAKNYDASGAYVGYWLGTEGILQAPRMPIVEHKVARNEALRRYGLKEDGVRDY